MATAIFGLCSTETYDSERFKNRRRSVQYQFPQGAFPLTGLLSIADSEDTNDPQFSHWEKRWYLQETTTASQGATKGPWKNSSDADPGDPLSLVADTEYILCVTDAKQFRLGKVLLVKCTNTSGATVNAHVLVTAMTDTSGTPNKLKVRALKALANIANGTTNESVGLQVLSIGTAFAEGRSNVVGERFFKPVEFASQTQIFRTPFRLTGSAMKAPLQYDVKGPHQDKAKEHSVEHMVDIENAVLWGTKSAYVDTSVEADPTTGAGLPLRTFGGIVYYLERWEAGDYGTVVVTNDDSKDKRIIENTTGAVDEDKFDGWMRKLFKVSNNSNNEKLCVCGGGALQVLNQLWRSKVTINTNMPSNETYGMKVVAIDTLFGRVYFKTHPLFSADSNLEYAALFLDVKNMKLRPMKDRDTKILANRQPNDADYRMDEWFTDIGFEMWFPESHMFVKNISSYTP